MLFWVIKKIEKFANFILHKYCEILKKNYLYIAVLFVLISPITLRIDIATRYFPTAIKVMENPVNFVEYIDSSPLFVIIISVLLFLTKSKLITIAILKLIMIVCIYYSIKYLNYITNNTWFLITTPVFLTYYALPVQNTFAIPFLLRSYIEFLRRSYKDAFIFLFIATLFRFELMILYPLYIYYLLKEEKESRSIFTSIGIFFINILVLLPFVENYISKYGTSKGFCLIYILFYPVRFFGITDFLKIKHIFFLVFNIVAFLAFFLLLNEILTNITRSSDKEKWIVVTILLFSILLSVSCVGYLAISRILFYIYPFIFKRIENKSICCLISLLFLTYSVFLILGYWYFVIKIILECKAEEGFIYSKELLDFYCNDSFPLA